MAHLEIEIKSLLGEKERADSLKAKMRELDPACTCVSMNKQLNHYFKDGDIEALYEFAEPVALTLDELDELILGAGFAYEAKWSREREEYTYKGANVCIDKNAGYGYLAEFEKVVPHDEAIAAIRSELDLLMKELGVEELLQDRLERMFAHYNEHWPEYYGTDRTFVIL